MIVLHNQTKSKYFPVSVLESVSVKIVSESWLIFLSKIGKSKEAVIIRDFSFLVLIFLPNSVAYC